MTKAPSSEARARNLALAARMVEVNEREGPWDIERHFDEFFHADFEWQPAVSEFGGRIYRGREGFREWIADVEAIASAIVLSDFEIRAVGEEAAAADALEASADA